MKATCLLLFGLWAFCQPLYAQRPDSIWVFGDNASIQFSNNGTFAYYRKINTMANSICIFSTKGLIYLDKNFLNYDTAIKSKISYFILDASRINYLTGDTIIYFCEKNFSGGGGEFPIRMGYFFFQIYTIIYNTLHLIILVFIVKIFTINFIYIK